MYLSDIIPNSDSNWVIKGNFLMYNKYINRPVAYIDDDVVYIFLDFIIIKPISKLMSRLIDLNIEFLFESPEMSNPSQEKDKQKVVLHYLYSNAQKSIRKEFQNINFDLIKNMVEFCDRNKCHDLIKHCYDKVESVINRSYFDYYSNKEIYDYDEDIRNDYKYLYRDIQISRII